MSISSPTTYPILLPPIEPDDLGSLGVYRVLGELGRGGMGYVFRAEDTRLKRIVALKVMNEKIAAVPSSRTRFIEEARAMAAIKHDNVATIYEVNVVRGTPFMAMELLHGGTLEELTKTHRVFDYSQVIAYGIQISRGLAAAHARGIIHRDIKPANIWIEHELNRVKILDFGLALAQISEDRLAGRGTVIGTPQYLSPEQARSEPLDDRTDLYSLGVVLYEMCAGELPFHARSVPEQLILTLLHSPRPPREINASVLEPLSGLILRLLEKEPRRRPRSARELERLLVEVEKECESKSDVALAINKLQQQLVLVAGKKEAIEREPVLKIPATSIIDIENPFAALPAVEPSDFSNRADRSGTSNASTPIRPTPGASMRASRGSPRRSRLTPTSLLPTTNRQHVWVWGAVALTATLLLAVATVWLVTSGSNREGSTFAENEKPIPVAPAASPSAPDAIPSPQPPSTLSRDMPEVSAPGEAFLSQQGAPKSESDASHDKQSSISSPATAEPLEMAARESGAIEKTFAPDREATIAPKKSLPNVNESMSPIDPANASEASKTQAQDSKPVQKVVISTGRGRGADTTVKRGSGSRDQFGENVTVVIQSRGDVDVQHSYLRFDLEADHKRLSRLARAELRLVLPGDAAPVGSTIRVYAVPEKYPDHWSESGSRMLVWNNSLSQLDLSDAPLVAEYDVSGEETGNEVLIRDERMDEFIRSVKEEFVTLILAGGAAENKPLHFVSREGSAENAPQLTVEIASD